VEFADVNADGYMDVILVVRNTSGKLGRLLLALTKLETDETLSKNLQVVVKGP